MPAIRVENLGKRYRINHSQRQAAYKTLRESLVDTLASPWRNWRSGAALGKTEDFWALQDISFDVQPGEVVGVIGRNGAGKSTLLKILSRITKPTTGSATIHGRVASLLEVGTGFNLELTGRENIYLSGAILGMSRREIDRQFDAIVDFSGVERFIDTPVKRYSSGMTVRLGFAVAAHLEPEILIIDEVLAVGDVEFQKKCLGKMRDASGHGRTVLFVSHNMNAVAQLCKTVILLEHGHKILHEDASQAIDVYLDHQRGTEQSHTVSSWDRQNRRRPFYTDITVNNVRLPSEVIIAPGEPLTIQLEGDTNGNDLRNFRAGIHLSSRDGVRLMSYTTHYSECGYMHIADKTRLQCTIDSVPLLPGLYYIDVNCGNGGERIDYLEKIGTLRVKPDDSFWPDQIPVYKHNGYFAVTCKWSVLNDLSVP